MEKRKIDNTGGNRMKRAMTLAMMSVVAIVVMTATPAWSEEGAWYDAGENWIVRAYTTPAGADYSVTLEVLSTGNVLIADPIVGMATNPIQIAGNAGSPDVSLAFDEGTATAYVLYTIGGAVTLQEMPDMVRAHGAMTVAPNPLLFGNVVKGKTLDKTVIVNNTGNIPVNIASIGTPGVPFSIVVAGTTCAVGTPVAVGGNCSIVVRFAPPAIATYSSSFGITTSVGNVTVNLNGSGGYGLGAGF